MMTYLKNKQPRYSCTSWEMTEFIFFPVVLVEEKELIQSAQIERHFD